MIKSGVLATRLRGSMDCKFKLFIKVLIDDGV